MNMLSEEATEALMESQKFLPSLVRSLHVLASFDQPDLLSSIIQRFNLFDYLWLELRGVNLISICLHRSLFETAIHLMLNAINYIAVVSMNNEKCNHLLLHFATYVRWRS